MYLLEVMYWVRILHYVTIVQQSSQLLLRTHQHMTPIHNDL